METVSFMRRLLTLFLLAMLQVLFLNRIALFGYVTPLFYIWMIVRFDSSMRRWAILLWSFFLGLVIDMFSGTPGLNAASVTLLAMFQPGLVKLFVQVIDSAGVPIHGRRQFQRSEILQFQELLPGDVHAFKDQIVAVYFC